VGFQFDGFDDEEDGAALGVERVCFACFDDDSHASMDIDIDGGYATLSTMTSKPRMLGVGRAEPMATVATANESSRPDAAKLIAANRYAICQNP
jgi:hypothetical protein